MSDQDAMREDLDSSIQAAFDHYEDAGLVSGWFLIAEVQRLDGTSYLAYRTGDINGNGLKSWQGLGYLHSAVGAVEDQARESTFGPGEGDDGD